MAIPAGEIGVGAVSGAALVGFILKVLPVLLRRMNGRNGNANDNGKPGKARVCIESGKKLVEHDIVIKHLCELSEKADKQYEISRKENREDHQKIFDKLDELK